MELVKDYIIFYTVTNGHIPQKKHLKENINQIILDKNLKINYNL